MILYFFILRIANLTRYHYNGKNEKISNHFWNMLTKDWKQRKESEEYD